MCHVFNEHEYDISPATYYTVTSAGLTPTQAELEEAYAAHKLYTLWVKARRIYVAGANCWKAALRAGWRIVRDQVQRLMNILGIKRALEEVATHPDQWRAADFTYVSTLQGGYASVLLRTCAPEKSLQSSTPRRITVWSHVP